MDRDQLVGDAERQVWDSYARGELVDLGPGDPYLEDFHLAQWTDDRVVRAEVVSYMLLGGREIHPGRIPRLRLSGARISGALDLNGGATEAELRFERCWFDEAPDFSNAATKQILFGGCHLPGFIGQEMQASGTIAFNGCLVLGELNLFGARIAGGLWLREANLVSPDRDPMDRDPAGSPNELSAETEALADPNEPTSDRVVLNVMNGSVEQGVSCVGLRTDGVINLLGARIGGQLLFSEARLFSPSAAVIVGQQVAVEGDVLCRNLAVAGTVDLLGAKIGGGLDMDGADLTGPTGTALRAGQITVAHSVTFGNGFKAKGTLTMEGATIGGLLTMDGATLDSPDRDALDLQRATIGAHMICLDNFTCNGKLDFVGAQIRGLLALPGARLNNPGDIAFNGLDLTVDEGILFQEGFTAIGTIHLGGAMIGGQLSLHDATLTGSNGLALNAHNMTISQDMKCSRGFIATGRISVAHATISRLDLTEADLRLPDYVASEGYCILDCEALRANELSLPPDVPATIDLRKATIGLLSLPVEAMGRPIRLSGLKYSDLGPESAPRIRHHLIWLRHDPDGYHPQSYEQLSSYYRANGQDREARIMLLAKRRAARRHANKYGDLPGPLRRLVTGLRAIPGWIIDGLTGYGYVPGRAILWLLVSVAAGTWLLYPSAPTGPTHSHLADAALLAIDSIIPTSPFGLRDAAGLTGGGFLTAMCLQILGYALSLAALPAITRTLARTVG